MDDIRKILVNENKTIKEAMKAIDLGAIRTAAVIDEHGCLVGVVSDGDIRRGILSGVGINERVPAVMNKNPVFATSDMPKRKIMDLLKEKKITCLPIVDDKKKVVDFMLLTDGTDILSISSFGKKSKLRTHLAKIAVIGGGGYIGSILVRKLLSKGYRVNVLDSFLYGDEPLKEIEMNPELKIIKGDTRHIDDVVIAIKDVDAVVHLAELVGDPACALSPATTQEINYLATQTLAVVCKHFQINRFVYMSSCSVYGESKGGKLLTEESELNPVSLYAKMKIASEKALQEMKDENFLPTVLRLSTVFGYSHRPRFDLVVNIMTAKALKDKKITVFGGSQWRPLVHVADVADVIMAVLEAPLEKVGGQIFNVGSEENNLTIRQVGEMVHKEIPEAELVINVGVDDKRDYRVDFSKLRKAVGSKVKHNVPYGINEVKQALKKNPGIDYADKRYSNIKFLEENGNNHAKK